MLAGFIVQFGKRVYTIFVLIIIHVDRYTIANSVKAFKILSTESCTISDNVPTIRSLVSRATIHIISQKYL